MALTDEVEAIGKGGTRFAGVVERITDMSVVVRLETQELVYFCRQTGYGRTHTDAMLLRPQDIARYEKHY